jgi:hypothetical protein
VPDLAQLTDPWIEGDDTGETKVGGTGVQRGSAPHAEADQEGRAGAVVEVLDRGSHIAQQCVSPKLAGVRIERPVRLVCVGTCGTAEVVDGEGDAAGRGEHHRQLLVERH